MVGKKKLRDLSQMPDTKSEFEIQPDGRHAHTVETPYGKIVYIYSRKTLSGIIAGIFTTLLGRAYYNRPLNFQKLLERPEDEPPYEYLFTLEPELLAEKVLHSKHAAELLWNQASRLLIESSEQLIQEVIFRTLSELHEQGKHKLNSRISELFKVLTADIIERARCA